MDITAARRRVGQTFVIGFQGVEPSEEVKKFIAEYDIGGIILFDRNIQSPAQLGDLTNELQDIVIKKSPQLFMSIDMEGGRVARLKAPFTQWPPMSILGEIGSPSLAFKFAEQLAKELLSVGINLNYSPCVDVLTNPANKVIGDRAFGTEPEIVSKMSSAVVRGFVKAGVMPCVKHFPGHGDTLLDSHEELPKVTHDLTRLDDIEFAPFKKAFRARADLVMVSHLILEKIDPVWPATLSSIVLQDILRKRLGYRNSIITDDMEMKAITKHYSVADAAVQAVVAGNTMVMYCHTLEWQKEAIEAIVKAVVDGKISPDVIEKNYNAVLKLKKDCLQPYRPVDVPNIGKVVGHPEHMKLAKAIARKEVPAGLTT